MDEEHMTEPRRLKKRRRRTVEERARDRNVGEEPVFHMLPESSCPYQHEYLDRPSAAGFLPRSFERSRAHARDRRRRQFHGRNP